MKTHYSSLHCPHCGSASFKIVSDDIFQCEYCNEKFNFDLDKIEFTSDNKIFCDELKDAFYEKIDQLQNEKAYYKSQVVRYSKLAHCRKLYYFSLLLTIFSFSFLLAGFVTFLSITFPIVCCVFLYFVSRRKKKKYEQYMPVASFYAAKAVSREQEIAVYTRLISKLTE